MASDVNQLYSTVRALIDQASTLMQLVFGFLVTVMLFCSMLGKYGVNVGPVPTVSSAQDMALYALVVALLAGRFSFGK